MLQTNDVIIISRNDHSSNPQCGIFISIQGDVVHFRMLDGFSQSDQRMPLKIEDLSIHVISLNVFRVSSVAKKSGLHDFAETMLLRLDTLAEYIDEPRLVDLVKDDQSTLLWIATLDIEGLKRLPKIARRAFELLHPKHLERVFFSSGTETQCTWAAQRMHSVSQLKRLILQRRSSDSVHIDDEKDCSRIQILMKRLTEIDGLGTRRWTRYQLLRRPSSIPMRTKFDLLSYCQEESVLKRISCREDEKESLRVTALRRLFQEDYEWTMAFIKTTTGSQFQNLFDDD